MCTGYSKQKENIHSILSGRLSDNFEAKGEVKAAGKFFLLGIQMQAIKLKKLAYCKGQKGGDSYSRRGGAGQRGSGNFNSCRQRVQMNSNCSNFGRWNYA